MDSFLTDLTNSISNFLPEYILIITLVLAIFIDVIFKKSKLITGYFSLVGYAATAIFLICGGITTCSINFTGLLSIDPLSQFFKILILLCSILTTIFTFNSKELLEGKNGIGEYYILLIGMTLGMFLLASSSNLIMIYLAFETMSICSYILAGYTKEIHRASEASLKYVIYGSLASGFMIYGMSLIFGLTGTLDLAGINTALVNLQGNELAAITAGIMIFAGFAYKISAVPFHFWTPDIYEGSPVATTAILSVASKAAGFAVLIRFIKAAFIDGSSSTADIWTTITSFDWTYFIAIISVITMTVGNLTAIWQNNVKRMLAYSSIAHCGYMLMGVMVMNTVGIEGILFYFITYLLMNFAAFYIVQLIANKIGSEDMNDYAGLVYKNPFIAVAMAITLLSLTGMPPFVGFLGKLYLFTPVIEAGYVGIAIIGVLNSVVSVFYYVKVIRNMFLRGDSETDEKISFSTSSLVFLYIMIVPISLLIINFQPLLEWVKQSAIMIIK
jgi:NADH-quinone oxidoreductase subunit N